jgi:trk system potassium uptake protein
MLIPAAFSLVAGDGNALAFAVPALAAVAFGAALFVLTRNPDMRTVRQDVFLIVVLGWLGVATFGALPFVISGVMGPIDAFFESMAGFTTTGASTVKAPEDLAPSLLLWRSMTQWAGSGSWSCSWLWLPW